ncbi:MAG TPA: hypothetical protein PLO78_10010 [Candidatus Omnitrophota bacterium]|nr:hypothetical protein [Candidatus Omnitrophota bacterium]
MLQNRRKHFFINKPLQIRYMLFLTVPLLIISAVTIFGFYIGIWGKVLDAFSDQQTREDLLTASRMIEYEQARHPETHQTLSSLSLFKQTEKLSARQREVFKEILNETNRSLLWKFALLLTVIAWGTVFLSHKIAGPLYRFSKAFDEMEKGNYRTRVFLRKLDEGHPVAEELNAALEKTDHLLAELKVISQENDASQAVAKIREKLSNIKTSADV